jgi:hypothetical protein
MTISPTSTVAGWRIAYAIASATAEGGSPNSPAAAT